MGAPPLEASEADDAVSSESYEPEPEEYTDSDGIRRQVTTVE